MLRNPRGLSARHLNVASYVTDFVTANHREPTAKEVQRAMGWDDVLSAVRAMEVLERRGFKPGRAE